MTVLAPNGAPATPRCAAWRCGLNIRPGNAFCGPHFQNVPGHIRRALLEELRWLRRKGIPPDQHTLSLLTIAASRELQHRVTNDPGAASAWAKFEADQVAAQKAGAAGIVGADGKPMGAPT